MSSKPQLPRLRTSGSTSSDPLMFRDYLEWRAGERKRRARILNLTRFYGGIALGLGLGVLIGRALP